MKEIAQLLVIIIMLPGWIMNIHALCNSDFEKPYRPEVIRAIGIPITPMGAYTGWVTLEGEEPATEIEA